jgi:hypothetical protein
MDLTARLEALEQVVQRLRRTVEEHEDRLGFVEGDVDDQKRMLDDQDRRLYNLDSGTG